MEAPAFGQLRPSPVRCRRRPCRARNSARSKRIRTSASRKGRSRLRLLRAPSFGRRDAEAERGQLLSGATTAAVDSAFNTLAQTVLVQNARTLEDLVREMLRPMLKTWLDDNLPGMVERLVRAEIERVARGR